MKLIGSSEFKEILLKSIPIIDVRAPVEFLEGSLPNSFNFPILNDSERALIGTTYKQQGQQEALRLGYELISGPIKEERLQAWRSFLQSQPEAILTCFRGGLRSQISQTWLHESGIDRPRIEGGYKAMRNYLLGLFPLFAEAGRLSVVSGATGAGKTLLLREIQKHRPICDLEKFAHHRGSAFGGFGDQQPRQIQFENQCALEFLRSLESQDQTPLLIEDESRLIGRCVQPDPLFEKLRASPVIVIEESLESRVQVTFNDYILGTDLEEPGSETGEKLFSRYQQSLQKISKKLGGLRHQEVRQDMDLAIEAWRSGRGLELQKVWIQKLLEYYYDPMYLGSLEKRQPQVMFRGSRQDCLSYLIQQRDRA